MLDEMGKQGRQAARLLGRAPAEQRRAVLERLAFYLENAPQEVLAANALDITDGRQEGLSPAMIDRLMLNQDRLAGMAADLRSVASMPDPLGEVFDKSVLPNGLRVHRQRVPIGVLGVIYKSRPNVTVDVAGLAIKTGNGAILRGGSETLRSNQALIALVHRALEDGGLPANSVQLIAIPDRALVLELLQLHEYVDLIIPRGGAGLHAFCREHSKIPVITGGIGICHLYVDFLPTWPQPCRLFTMPRCSDLRCAMPWIRCWCTRPSPEKSFRQLWNICSRPESLSGPIRPPPSAWLNLA